MSMYASVVALVLLGFALAWTTLNKSGIPAYDWYISLVLIGLSLLIFWSRPRRLLSPPFPRWLTIVLAGLAAFLIFQALPLPLGALQFFSPNRAELARALEPITGKISYAPIAVDVAAHILWLLTLLGCAVAFFLIRDLTFRFRKRLFVAMLPLFMVATLEALLGLFQIAGGAPQAIGSYNSRDHYVGMLEMTLPVLIAFGFVFWARRREQATIWPILYAIGCWFAATLLMLGILFSLSRAGWVDSILALILLAALLLFPRVPSLTMRVGILAGSLLSVFLIFLFASPGAMLNRLVSTLTSDSEGRLTIWSQLTPLLHQYRWFGTGLMGFNPLFLQYQDFTNSKRVDFAHCDFLQYLIEMGWIGFLPLMVSLFVVVRPIVENAWGLSRRPETAEPRLLAIGCVAGLFTLFLHSFVDFNLYVPANVLAFAWILGFGSAIATLTDARRFRDTSINDTPVEA